jgi:hypothetical protein
MKPGSGIRCCCIAGLLMSGAGSQAAGAGSVYQWTDAAGRLNYSDIPPRHAPAQTREIRAGEADPAVARGLRPGELKTLENMARRAHQEHKDALAARERNDRQVEKTRKACEDYREKFRNARKDEDYGKYSLFLRMHCW